MAGNDEHQRHHAFQYNEYLSMSEDGGSQPESPGMLNVQHLSANHFQSDDTEVPAKVMKRPISSGSSGSRNFTFTAAPKRDLQIAKKHSTNLLDVPQVELSSNQETDKPTNRETATAQGKNQQRSGSQIFHASVSTDSICIVQLLKRQSIIPVTKNNHLI